MITVLIVDDQALARDGLEMILGASDEIDVLGKAENGAEALALLERLRPTLVLMDLKMPIMNGVQATRIIRQQYPDVKVLVLTTYDSDEWVFDAIRAGAAGYLLKDSPRDVIIKAIQDATAGRTVTSPQINEKLYQFVQQGTPSNSDLAAKFNERELEILNLMANGFSNGEIALRIHLAEGTVRNYVSTILEKLEVSDRTQAAAMAWRYGLVNPNDLS